LKQRAPLAVITAAFGLIALTAFARADHSPNLIGLLALDVNTQGNTATSLGPLDGCARVEPGGRIDVDYVVDAIPDDRALIGFQVEIRYNPDLLEVVAVDYDLMLAAVGSYQPFGGGDLTDPLPDSDGSYNLVVLDMASQTENPDQGTQEANVERGPGVLARITFQGKGSGVSEVNIGYDPLNGGAYPLTLDTQGEIVITDKIGGASVAVGQDCPAEAIPPRIIDPPNTEEEIHGGTPPPPVPGATPEGQTPAEGGVPTPEGQTPTPEGQTPAPGEVGGPAAGRGSPTPSPIEDDIVDEEEDSNTGLFVGAFALLGLGTAAAGGGWYMFRRSRNGVT
jgi:hypothetical protein